MSDLYGNPIQLIVRTRNSHVHMALVNMRIEGINQDCPLRKDYHSGWEVLVELMNLVAAGIFIELIRDLVHKHDDNTIEINGHKMPEGETSSAFVARVIDRLIIDNHLQKNADNKKEDVDS
jgi:hypothetical protein